MNPIAEAIQKSFLEFGEKLEQMENRLVNKIDNLETKFTGLEGKFDLLKTDMDKNFEHVNKSIDYLSVRVARIEDKLGIPQPSAE